MCRAICRTCVESSPAGGPSSHPTPGRGAGVPCTPQANAARPATAYLCYYAAEGRGVHRMPPARAVRAASGWCRLTVSWRGPGSGHGPGRRARPSRDDTGQSGAAQGHSRAAGAAGQPGPGTATAREPGRRAGPQTAPWTAGPRSGNGAGWKLPAARSLRISGPEDKKFRSREEKCGRLPRNQNRARLPARRTGRRARADKNRAGPGGQEQSWFRRSRGGPVL